jgi:hypothetical protein
MSHEFFVTPRVLSQFDGILGNDWFNRQKAVINYESSCVETPSFALPFKRTIKAEQTSNFTILEYDDQLAVLEKHCLKNGFTNPEEENGNQLTGLA